MNVVPDPAFVMPDPTELGSEKSRKVKKSWTLKPLRQAWENLISRKIKVTPADAVAKFLTDMKRVAERLFPDWESSLKAHVQDTDLDFLAERQLFERHQEMLEENTEHLQELIETKKLKSLDRTELINYTRITERFRNSLLRNRRPRGPLSGATHLPGRGPARPHHLRLGLRKSGRKEAL